MTGAAHSIDLLLVDDHRVFAEALSIRLRQHHWIRHVSVAFDLSGAKAVLARETPDVVLLDLHLDGESGLDLLGDADGPGESTRILVLSASQDVREVIDALRRGADGWVSKHESLDAILAATQAVHAGRMYLPQEALRPVVSVLLGQPGPDEPRGFVAKLSPREFEVLRCLVAGMTRAEVAKRLFVSTNTVRTHVQKVLRAADVHSTVAVVAEARRLGVQGIDCGESIAPPSHSHWSE